MLIIVYVMINVNDTKCERQTTESPMTIKSIETFLSK